jgi:hypothetical protein
MSLDGWGLEMESDKMTYISVEETTIRYQVPVAAGSRLGPAVAHAVGVAAVGVSILCLLT